MDVSKFTPWTPGYVTGPLSPDYRAVIDVVFDSQRDCVAFIADRTDATMIKNKIAAAPELYEALKAMRFAYMNKDMEYPHDFEIEALYMYDRAIAKADGKYGN